MLFPDHSHAIVQNVTIIPSVTVLEIIVSYPNSHIVVSSLLYIHNLF